MFACIYCDDNTLAVIGKQSKRLKLLGEFKVKENVELTWPGTDKLYKGTIVKINEKEDYLTAFANKAYSKFLKNYKKTEVPGEIFSYDHDEPVAAKRSRVATKKITESKEQDGELSPKKKKKTVTQEHEKGEQSPQKKKKTVQGKKQEHDKSNTNCNPAKVRSEKKKTEEQVSILVGSSMLSDLDSQFSSISSGSENESQIDVPSEISPLRKTTKTNTETSLTTTWSLCTSGSANVPAKFPGQSSLPVPSPVILDFLDKLSQPEVQDFCRQLVEYFRQQNNEDCPNENVTNLTDISYQNNETNLDAAPFGQISTSAIDTSLQYQMNLRRSPRKHQSSTPNSNMAMPGSFGQISTSAIDTSLQYQMNIRRSPRKNQSSTPNSNMAMPGYIETANDLPPNYLPHYTTSGSFPAPGSLPVPNIQFNTQQYQTTYQPQPNPTFCNSQSACSSSYSFPVANTCNNLNDAKSPQDYITGDQYRSTSGQNCSAAMESCNQNTPKSSQQNIPQNTSSAKSTQSTHENDDQRDDNAMVRLLQSSDLKVKRGNLRKAWAAARKAPNNKSGFRLASCLLPMLFTDLEMASSCGQGLKKKTNDIRPPLDPTRVGLIKDYVSAWCQKNGKGEVPDGQINDAITEQISYSRKKLKKQNC